MSKHGEVAPPLRSARKGVQNSNPHKNRSMREAITLQRMRALEANSEWLGISRRLLMENAGAGVVRELWDHKPPEKRVAVFAGTGNNGGDGFVAARHILNRGVGVDVVVLGDPTRIATREARENWKVLTEMHDDINFYIIKDSKDLQALSEVKSDVLIDAILGTGITGKLREPVASAVKSINRRKAFKVAVDAPSGLSPSTGEVAGNAAKCDLTVTFHDTKPGLEGAEEYTGSVSVVDIGIPRSAERLAGPGDLMTAMPPRETDSHKGQHGRLLIVGGGSKYVGAPGMAGLAALRAGADLATIAAPERTAEIINSFSPDLITYGLPCKDLEPSVLPELDEQIDRATAVIIGPGLGVSSDAQAAVLELAQTLSEKRGLPVLFDADGLKMMADEKSLLKDKGWLVTPHQREFELLTGTKLSTEESDRVEDVSSAAEELGCTILLKSYVDICANPEGNVTLNTTGNPGMTVGGTGDVLVGIIGSFLSRDIEPLSAASAGAFLCGRSGDLCSREMGYEFTATDVVDQVPAAISEAREYW